MVEPHDYSRLTRRERRKLTSDQQLAQALFDAEERQREREAYLASPEGRIETLEAQVAELRCELDSLKQDLVYTKECLRKIV